MKTLKSLLIILITALFPGSWLSAAHPLHFKHDEAQLAFSENGGIAVWQLGGRRLISGNGGEGLTLSLESGEEGRFEAGGSRLEERSKAKGPTTLVFDGVLRVGTRRVAEAKLLYRIAPDLSTLRLAIELKWDAPAEGQPPARISRIRWQQPLALNPRKRTFFQGDHGLPWETRYFYQFHLNTKGELLPQPDRNEWRFFGLDQLGQEAFRLWKAESETTSPLRMQEGREAAPWVEVFDERKGVALFYPRLAQEGPKSVRVDMAGGALLAVELWPAFAGPLALDDPRAIALAKEGWTFELLAFDSEAGRKKARAERLAGYPASPRVDPAKVLEEPEWVRKTPLATGADGPRYVTGGHPLARGELRPGEPLFIRIGKRKVPTQQKPLAYWPDGSIKWVQLTFPWESGQVRKKGGAPWLSLRGGGVIPYTVERPDAKAAAPTLPGLMKAEVTPEAITIDTGPMTVTFATGSRWLSALSVDGRALLDPERPVTAYVEYARDWKRVEPWLAPEGGTREKATLKVEELSLMEHGPLRSVVRLAGHLKGEHETTRVLLWVSLHRDRAELAFTHTTEFLLSDPRRTMLTALGVSIPLAASEGERYRLHAGGFAAPDPKSDRLLLLQTTPLWSEAIAETSSAVHPVSLARAKKEEGRGWLAVSIPGGGQLVGILRDFKELAPSGMSFADGTLRFELWPKAAAPMDVRRYSDYPHRGQGESVDDARETWVAEQYYTGQPFAGTSRTREFTLAFLPEKALPQSLAADLQSPPLLYAGWPRYLATGVVLEAEDAAAWPRVHEAKKRFARFWLYHRELHQWYGFWQYGDVRHLFRNGYGWVLPPDALAKALHASKEDTGNPLSGRVQDYFPPNDWAFDNGRWGWSSTEGLPGLFFQNLYLQTGRRSLFFAAEGLARIARDVVTRHSGKLLGLGTRHGVQHWSDGNHEERQTVALEYRLHHYLTGEPRSREVVDKLYAHRYRQAAVKVNAAHSGRLAGLLFHWEMTGSREEGEQLGRYIQAFLSPEGIYEQPDVRFAGGLSIGERGKLNEGSMFFHTFGAMHSLLEYDQITERSDPALKAALVAQAKAFLADPARTKNKRWITLHGGVLGYAARHAPEAPAIRKRLRALMLERDWSHFYQPLTENPRHWSGPSAYLAQNIPGSMFALNTLGWLAGGIGGEEPWSPAMEEAFRKREREGAPPSTVRPGWQSEYDGRPELDAYLGRQLPWRSTTP